MDTDTTGIIIGSGAVGALCGVASTWIRAKVAQRRARPLDSADTYVTHAECQQHRCAIEKRIDEIGPALNRIFLKLNENDRRSEGRAVKIHERIGPIAEGLAATAATVEMMKGKKQ